MSEQSFIGKSLDLVRLSLKNIRRRPVLSFLTTLGIATGMTAIVSLWILSSSLEAALDQQFERFGHNTLLVIPAGPGGSQSTQTIRIDPDFLTSLEGIENAGYILRKTLPFLSNQTQGFALILGLSEETFSEGATFFESFELQRGVIASNRGEITISAGFANQLDIEVGDSIEISDQPYRVAGILAPVSDRDLNSAVFVSIEELWSLNNSAGEVSFAWVKALDETDLASLEAQISESMASLGQPFTIQSSQNLRSSVQAILGILRTTLTGIAAIALFVGALGLMNTMYMAVIERTREIGIYLSLGARKSQVLALFVIESGTLGLMGGIAGLIIGTGLSSSLSLLFGQALGSASLVVRPELKISLLALALAILLGIISGMIPALRAASIRPADALRYE